MADSAPFAPDSGKQRKGEKTIEKVTFYLSASFHVLQRACLPSLSSNKLHVRKLYMYIHMFIYIYIQRGDCLFCLSFVLPSSPYNCLSVFFFLCCRLFSFLGSYSVSSAFFFLRVSKQSFTLNAVCYSSHLNMSSAFVNGRLHQRVCEAAIQTPTVSTLPVHPYCFIYRANTDFQCFIALCNTGESLVDDAQGAFQAFAQ